MKKCIHVAVIQNRRFDENFYDNDITKDCRQRIASLLAIPPSRTLRMCTYK